MEATGDKVVFVIGNLFEHIYINDRCQLETDHEILASMTDTASFHYK